MKFGLSLPIHGVYADPHLHVELAVSAEKSGWNGYFVWDHLVWRDEDKFLPTTDPWITLSAIAVQTSRIKLGPMVTPLARRRPWQVARESVALDHLSRGRMILGIGLGAFVETEWQPFGEVSELRPRGRMLDEALEVITGLWSGEPFSFDGEFYQIEETQFTPTPFQNPRIPIWVAGSLKQTANSKPQRRAARYDGSYPLAPEQAAAPEIYEELVTFLAQHRTGQPPIEIVCEREFSQNGIGTRDLVQTYADVGVTWWLPNGPNQNMSLDEIRRLIVQGPPRD